MTNGQRLSRDVLLPPITRCECGADPVEIKIGLYWTIVCETEECNVPGVICSTRIGAIQKWNRSIRITRTTK